jgi:Na+-driven multidrug efflux pump
MVEKKSIHILLTTLTGALINIVLNFILIINLKEPRWQYAVDGAAFATFFSYGAVFVLRAINTRRFIPVQWGFPKLLINAALLGVQAVILMWSPPGWIIYEILMCLGMIGLNFKGLWATLMRVVRREKKSSGPASGR